MKRLNIAVLGATGAVGQEMIRIMIEKKISFTELRLLASGRSAGKQIMINNKRYTVEETAENSFDDIDYVLGAAENNIAKKYLPLAVKKGAVVIDNSSAFRLNKDVPLIIPEVNPEQLKYHKGLIANPNCATIIGLVALAPLHKEAKAKRMIVSTYQAVSGAGRQGIEELDRQIEQIRTGEPVTSSTFRYQIAYNLIPQIGNFKENGYSSEEMKMQNEGRKILGTDDFSVNCTCVRVPVYRSHSESITVEFENELGVERAKELLSCAKGIKLVDDPDQCRYPMPLEAAGQDLVYVGRIRKDMSGHKNALSFWCCGDQLRKGAAANAVQILELLIADLKN